MTCKMVGEKRIMCRFLKNSDQYFKTENCSKILHHSRLSQNCVIVVTFDCCL